MLGWDTTLPSHYASESIGYELLPSRYQRRTLNSFLVVGTRIKPTGAVRGKK